MMTGYLCDLPSTDLVERGVQAGARPTAPRSDLVTTGLWWKKRHRAGLQVVAVDGERTRTDAPADRDGRRHGIISDYPDRLADAMREE